MPDRFLNIATYRFTPLADLPALRQRLFDLADAHGIRGTVLLADEGINLCLAGPADGMAAWLAAVRTTPGLADLPTKDSWSTEQPFQRLKVKIKAEIIRMNMPAVRPCGGPRTGGDGHHAGTLAGPGPLRRRPAAGPAGHPQWRSRWTPAPSTAPSTGGCRSSATFLPRWPHTVRHLAGHTVVSYCTGGIRCEKAALVMQDLGITHALQLEGGILKYFEDTGGAAPGWRGACFVFDERVALAPSLQPATAPVPIPVTAPLPAETLG